VIFLEFDSSSPTVETVGYENIVSIEIVKCLNNLHFFISHSPAKPKSNPTISYPLPPIKKSPLKTSSSL
jgi:hypothetical protein